MTGSGSRAGRLGLQRKIDQGLSEMVGLVHGVIADGSVTSDEAARLARWVREHPEVVARYPANMLARRLERIFQDGRMDGRERRRLAALLAQLAGNPQGLAGGFRLATDLPVTRPAPEVRFEGRTFVFAGELGYGPLHACEREVTERGGACERLVSRRTDYLVIGELAAEEWSQAGFGDLLDEVVEYRARGVPIAVVDEPHWVAALD